MFGRDLFPGKSDIRPGVLWLHLRYKMLKPLTSKDFSIFRGINLIELYAPCWNRTSLKANYELAASPIGQRRLFLSLPLYRHIKLAWTFLR